MQLIDIQRRFVEVGRLRYGEKVPTSGGKSRPSRLETWRLTSPNKAVIEAAAAKYGGSVVAWEEQWEVITTSATLEVMLPPQTGVRSYSLYYELWSGGGCQRRCDGSTELLSGGSCLCDPDQRECKPTLRVPFFLPDLPGLGVFRLETGGFNAAAELPGMLDLLSTWSQAGRPVRALLRLEKRTSKKGGQTRHYTVPVIDLPYSLAELAGTALPALSGNGVPALGTNHAATESTAIAAEAAVTEQVEELPAANRSAPPPDTAPDAPPAPAPVEYQLGDVLDGDMLQRWRAGLHAAMRERIPADQDEHVALRALAQGLVQLGDRSLNEMTYREWIAVARALQLMPKRDPNESVGASDAAEAAEPEPSPKKKPPAPVRANETGEADPPGAPAAIDAADGEDPPLAPSAVEQPAVPAGEGGEPVAVAAENGSSTPSVGTPTSLAAFHIYAAAALNIEDPAGYEVSELNQIELERVIETLGIEDYGAWFDKCSRELRAVLRNQKMSPKQRADRQANAETEANLAAAGLTSKT